MTGVPHERRTRVCFRRRVWGSCFAAYGKLQNMVETPFSIPRICIRQRYSTDNDFSFTTFFFSFRIIESHSAE